MPASYDLRTPDTTPRSVSASDRTRPPRPARSAWPSRQPASGKKPLPAGRPREWYEAHNRRLKAMRLAIALLESGLYTPQQARNRAIRRAAVRIGVHRPSNATCRMVRELLP